MDSDNAQSDSTDNTAFSAPAVQTSDPFADRDTGYVELEAYRNGFGGGMGLSTSEFFADIVTFSKNFCGATNFTNGSGDDFENVGAYLEFDTRGLLGLFFDFKTGGSTAANNGLLKEL